MRKSVNVLTTIGVFIFVVYSLIDRFITRIPDIVAIPILILGVILMATGVMKTCKSNFTK